MCFPALPGNTRSLPIKVDRPVNASDPHVKAFAEIFGDPPADFAVPVDWAAVESWLGMRLPADYKAIAAAYGPLDIGAWLWLHMPCVNRGWFGYGTWVQQTRRNAPGVLPFGATRTADTLYWDTTASDDPDQWPVVMHCQDDENAGRDPWRRFATPLVPNAGQARGRRHAPGGRPKWHANRLGAHPVDTAASATGANRSAAGGAHHRQRAGDFDRTRPAAGDTRAR